MVRIRYVDCRRTKALTKLRNDYVALQQIEPDNKVLTLATLDDDGWGMTFSDKYFEEFVPKENPSDEDIKSGRLKYRLVLRSNWGIQMDSLYIRGGGVF